MCIFDIICNTKIKMKKSVLLIAIVFIGLFACTPSTKEINNVLNKNVVDAEIITNYHDSILQLSLEKQIFDSIPQLTKETSTFLAQKLAAIQELKVPSIAESYKTVTIDYIRSMMDLVKTQDLYAAYSDTISEQEIISLDNMNAKAIKNVEIQHAKYIEYQKAFSKSDNS